MQDADEDLNDYIQREDAFREAQQENVTFAGGVRLHFYLVIDPSNVVRPIYQSSPRISERDVRGRHA